MLEEMGVVKFYEITDLALYSPYDPGIKRVWHTGIIEHAVPADCRKDGISYYKPGDTFQVPAGNNPLD